MSLAHTEELLKILQCIADRIVHNKLQQLVDVLEVFTVHRIIHRMVYFLLNHIPTMGYYLCWHNLTCDSDLCDKVISWVHYAILLIHAHLHHHTTLCSYTLACHPNLWYGHILPALHHIAYPCTPASSWYSRILPCSHR